MWKQELKVSLRRETAEQILTHNAGFTRPEQWVDYAVRERFRFVRATTVIDCPDCGEPTGRILGQYIHYSTLIRLRECRQCGLIWSDVRIDWEVVRSDMERTYHKQSDVDYFTSQRLPVFKHLSRLIDEAAPPNGTVLDIGGAQGHLMDMLWRRRPDLVTWVHDITVAATRYASEHFGLPTICGTIDAVLSRGMPYDVVVMSDVLYYEPQLGRLWSALRSLLKPGGRVFIRVPNKLPYIRVGALAQRIRGKLTGRLEDHLPVFNPAHAYVLSRGYLKRRLHSLGFQNIRLIPSPLLATLNHGFTRACSAMFRVLDAANRAVPGLVLTPSMLVTASWPGQP